MHSIVVAVAHLSPNSLQCIPDQGGILSLRDSEWKTLLAGKSRSKRSRSVPLFALLDDEAVTGLRALLQFRAASPGTVLFNYGEEGNAMYLIEDGKVSIHLQDADMNDVALAELAKGDFLGEMAILSSKPRSATATVSEEAELWVLKSSDFLTFISPHPRSCPGSSPCFY